MRERLILQCNNYSKDWRWAALTHETKSTQTTHFSVSIAKHRFTFLYHNSDVWQKNATVKALLVSSSLNIYLGTQSFQSRELILWLPSEIKNTEGKHILTNVAWSPQPARELKYQRVSYVQMYFKTPPRNSTIKLRRHRLPPKTLMKIAAGSKKSRSIRAAKQVVSEMADPLNKKLIPGRLCHLPQGQRNARGAGCC